MDTLTTFEIISSVFGGLAIMIAGLQFYKSAKKEEEAANSSEIKTEGQRENNLVQQQKGGQGNQIIQNQTIHNHAPPPTSDPQPNAEQGKNDKDIK